MNNQEAIRRIKDHMRIHCKLEYPRAIKITEALNTAISALETQQADMWISVLSGILPNDRTEVDVTIREKANEVGGYRYYTAIAWLQDEKWIFKQNQYEPVIIAWKHRPEPYKEG